MSTKEGQGRWGLQGNNKGDALSKTRQKTSTEIRHLQGENKKLKKKVAQLERTIEKWQLSPPSDKEEEIIELPKRNVCKECGRGELEVMEIIGRVYTTCPICGHRERVDNKDG